MKSLYINKLDVKLLDYHWTKITVFGLKYPLFGLNAKVKKMKIFKII